jgi:hypothetical protein
MIHQLIPETTLRSRDEMIRRVIRPLIKNMRYSQSDTEDAFCGAALRYYLLFTLESGPRQIGLPHLNAETTFYNRYYWFRRFATLSRLKYGEDAGIEQQVFQLLEYPECDPDWFLVEKIHNLAESDAGAW